MPVWLTFTTSQSRKPHQYLRPSAPHPPFLGSRPHRRDLSADRSDIPRTAHNSDTQLLPSYLAFDADNGRAPCPAFYTEIALTRTHTVMLTDSITPNESTYRGQTCRNPLPYQTPSHHSPDSGKTPTSRRPQLSTRGHSPTKRSPVHRQSDDECRVHPWYCLRCHRDNNRCRQQSMQALHISRGHEGQLRTSPNSFPNEVSGHNAVFLGFFY